MNTLNKLLPLLVVCLLTGCMTGVTPAGPDTYMIAGAVTGFESPGIVKARLYKQANEWCAKQGLVMVPVSSDATPYELGRRAGNVELFFRALKPGDPDIKRVNPEKPDTTQRIEVR
jgi:hypothetical protein